MAEVNSIGSPMSESAVSWTEGSKARIKKSECWFYLRQKARMKQATKNKATSQVQTTCSSTWCKFCVIVGEMISLININSRHSFVHSFVLYLRGTPHGTSETGEPPLSRITIIFCILILNQNYHYNTGHSGTRESIKRTRKAGWHLENKKIRNSGVITLTLGAEHTHFLE